MKWLQKHKGIIVEVICYIFILLFVYAAVSKVTDLRVFQVRLTRMPYISPYAQWISLGIPFLELVIAGLLLYRNYRRIGLFASLILLALFTTYIAIVLKYSDSIPCSCGGVISALGWKDHILLNITFMLLALLGVLWSKKHNKPFLNKNTAQ